MTRALAPGIAPHICYCSAPLLLFVCLSQMPATRLMLWQQQCPASVLSARHHCCCMNKMRLPYSGLLQWIVRQLDPKRTPASKHVLRSILFACMYISCMPTYRKFLVGCRGGYHVPWSEAVVEIAAEGREVLWACQPPHVVSDDPCQL